MPKILVADNQPEWREFAMRVLDGQGYEVRLTEGIEHLDTLLEGNGYDLVLLGSDLMHEPSRDALRSIVARNPEEPVVVVSVPSSAYRTVQETRIAFRLGARDCVDKPFSAERLLVLVGELLREFGGRYAREHGGCA